MLGKDLAVELSKSFEVVTFDKEELDICNYQQVHEKVSLAKPDLIINAAAYTNVDGAETEYELAEKINGDALKNLTRVAYDNVALLVHFSTEMVFDGVNRAGYNEDSAPNPINKYGQSKLKGEQYVLEWSANYPDFKYWLIRTSWLYGKNPQMGKPRGKNFIDSILEKVTHGETVKIVNDQFGKPTNSLDLVQALSKMIKDKNQSGIYHLVNEGVTSWYELAKQAAIIKYNTADKILSCSSSEYPTPAKRAQFGVLNNNKLTKMRSWRLALEDYLD